jgi:hypothetical protein
MNKHSFVLEIQITQEHDFLSYTHASCSIFVLFFFGRETSEFDTENFCSQEGLCPRYQIIELKA